jgi:hypothetical protein
MPAVPYFYVARTPLAGGVDIASMEVNPQGIHYVINTRYAFDNKFLPSYGVDFYTSDYMIRVGLELYGKRGKRGAKSLNKDLFFKSVIDSFNVSATQ